MNDSWSNSLVHVSRTRAVSPPVAGDSPGSMVKSAQGRIPAKGDTSAAVIQLRNATKDAG